MTDITEEVKTTFGEYTFVICSLRAEVVELKARIVELEADDGAEFRLGEKPSPIRDHVNNSA